MKIAKTAIISGLLILGLGANLAMAEGDVGKGVRHDGKEIKKGSEHVSKERHKADKHADKEVKKDL